MENFNYKIKEIKFPAPANGWLKSFCEQNNTKQSFYCRIKIFDGIHMPEIFKIERN